MKLRLIGFCSAVAIAVAWNGVTVVVQTGNAEAKKHMAAAQTAAMQDHAWMYTRLCIEALANVNNPPPPSPAAGQRSGPPPRENWHAEPLKVFDNLYFVGQSEYSAWAVTTSDGIILMDAIFDYSVEDEVIEGLKKLGLDPSTIKYVILGHWHSDHAGGAKLLQERYGARLVMGAADWDAVETSNPVWKPKKDIVATDGMQVTLGDTSVTIYTTPGHTSGTLSSIIPVRDAGRSHVAAYWGGTMYNWINRTTAATGEYAGKPESFWFTQYAESAARFKEIAARAGADVVLSNHTIYDGSKYKMPQMALREPGDAFHPYVVGPDSVQRYVTVVGECARAGAVIAK